jgi:hypothetical protein
MRVKHIAVGPVALAAATLIAFTVRTADAHKPITSRYTYNADVFPVFSARCGECHRAGGPAPMSLLAYKDAVPWAESIREELVAEKMPPSFVDPFGPAVKGDHTITPKELDTILTWATGGTPEGDPGKRPVPHIAVDEWPMGKPDVVVAMPVDHVVSAKVTEEVAELTLDTGLNERRWLKGADLQPGDASIVRDATISVENGRVLAVWVPGEHATMAPDDAGFEVAAGARLTLRIHYKKGWQDERAQKTDRSRVGLYFAGPAASAHPISSVGLNGTTAEHVTVVAVRPRLDRPYGSIDVHAVLTDGTTMPLLRLSHPRPEWPRRYWLEKPIALPAGARIAMTTTPARIDPDDPPKPPAGQLEAAVEFISK